MKPEWKKKWIKALTSGKYKQTRESLRSERDGFCCLGVLCDVVSPKGWKHDSGGWSYRGDPDSLPNSVMRRVGLKMTEDFDESAISRLIRLNDNSKANFTKIAAWIKDNL